MALKGDLASVDLAQVFQMLSLNQKVGILGIDAKRAGRALHFDSRGVTIYFDEPLMEERIIMQARRMGSLDEGALQDARAHSQRTGQSVIESLTAGGYVDEGSLADMIRVELEEDIYDIFFWRQAQFEFYENLERPPTGNGRIDERFYFAVDTVIMEAARRIDEWAFIQQRVQSGEDVFRALQVDPSQLGEVETLIFDHADGMHNVARMIDLTGLPRFQVFKSLAVLHEGGYIENVPDEELWDYARHAVKAERPEDAIDLFELAIANGADCSSIRAEAATVYEAIEEYAKAAQHLKKVAESHIEAGEVHDAIAHMQHVVTMLPTDLDAREALVELTVGMPDSERDGFDPTADGKELVDLYIEIGEIERVRSILEQLLRDSPHDLALKKRLINVHTKAGDTRRVVELYESIADDLVDEREPIEAIKYLQKIVMIDRSRRDISERIRSLYEADERRRSRRRSLLGLGIVLLLLCALGGGWYGYECYARSQSAALLTTVHNLASESRFDEAVEQLDEFIAQYPLTMVSGDIAAEKARIVSQRDRHEEQQRLASRRLEIERQEIRKKYRTAWNEYEEHARAERLDQALIAIKSVQKLIVEAGAPEDLEWARRMNVDDNKFELERFISDAARLDREAWAKLEKGDWQGARATWTKLLDDYEISATSRTVKLPVMLRSRPLGAGVFSGGKPMTNEGSDEPLVTPCVVLCSPAGTETFELRLSGFATAVLEVDSRVAEAVEPTLKVVPKRVFEFGEPIRTAAAVGRGLLGVGLRNGKIAFAAIESGEIRAERQLEGLDEVRGVPRFAVDRCYYLTTEGYLASRRVSTGDLIWREKLKGDPIHDPVLHSGRILLADSAGTLHVFDPLTGRPMWNVSLGGNVAGEPAFDNGTAFYGLREGRIVAVSLSGRKVEKTSPRLQSGVSTQLIRRGAGFIYGDDRGRLVGRPRFSSGKPWARDLDRSLGPDDFVVSGDDVFALAGRSSIVKYRAADGEELRRLDLTEAIVAGPLVSERRVFVVVRVQRRNEGKLDVLQAYDRENFELEWEFEDGGRFVAPPTIDQHSLYLPDSKGNILRFR